jgi:hypothetical protein
MGHLTSDSAQKDANLQRSNGRQRDQRTHKMISFTQDGVRGAIAALQGVRSNGRRITARLSGRTMSASARRRIAAAQKARWAKGSEVSVVRRTLLLYSRHIATFRMSLPTQILQTHRTLSLDLWRPSGVGGRSCCDSGCNRLAEVWRRTSSYSGDRQFSTMSMANKRRKMLGCPDGRGPQARARHHRRNSGGSAPLIRLIRPKTCSTTVQVPERNGRELAPKTKNAVREIDIDPGLAELLRQHIGDNKAGRVFEARNGSPISGNNVLKRVLHPLLERLGIPRAGLAFRHSRSPCCEKGARQRTCRSSGLGIPLCEQRTGTLTLIRNLSIGVWLQAKRGLISMLDPIDPKLRLGLSRQVLERMVRPERFELPTFWFVARRSIQLS